MYYAKKFILLLLRAFIILTIFLVMVVSGFIWNKSFRDLVLEKQESLSGYDVSIGSLESSRDFLSIKNFRVSKAQREIVKGDEITVSPQYLSLFSSRPIIDLVVIKNTTIDLELPEAKVEQEEESSDSESQFNLKKLEITNSNIRVASPKEYNLQVNLVSLNSSEISEIGVDKIDIKAEVEYHRLQQSIQSDKDRKDEKVESSGFNYSVKQLEILESRILYRDQDINEATVILSSVRGKGLSEKGIVGLDFLGDLAFLKTSTPAVEKVVVINSIQFKSGLKFGNDQTVLSAVELSFPTQEIYLDNKLHEEAKLNLLGEFEVGSTSTGHVKSLTYDKGAENILEISGNFSIAEEVQEVSFSLTKLSSVFVEEFTELPTELRHFNASGEYKIILDKYKLQNASGNGLFNKVTLASDLKRFPDLDFVFKIESDGVTYGFKESLVKFQDSEKVMGEVRIMGSFDSLKNSIDMTSSIAIEDLRKMIFFLKGVSIAQNRPLDADIKINGTTEKLNVDLTKFHYAEGTLQGNLVKEGDDFDILVSGKKLLAKDLYELSILKPSDDMSGQIENVFGEIKYSKKYPLGVIGNFKMKGTDFNFSNRLQDIFPFNLLFLPLSVLDKTLSAFPAQLIPTQLSSFSSATKGSIDNLQRIKANTITINGKSDGEWVTLDEALFNMSGVTPDIEIPGKISKDSLNINSGIFLVGNKVPLPIFGEPNFPLPDIVGFTKELAKTVLNAPLNTIKSIGGLTGISSLFGDEKVEDVDIDEILKQRAELLEKINEEGVADFVVDKVEEKSEDSDPEKVSIEQSLDEEEKGRPKVKIESDEIKALNVPNTPKLLPAKD